MKTLKNENLTVSVKSFGAELVSIKSNKNGREYLWQADPAFWKRHSPILFPIVGGLNNGECKFEGQVYKMSQHGFARDMDFELLSETETEVFYSLKSNKETLTKYPYAFQLIVGYRLKKNGLEVIWEVRNEGETTMYFQIGAHPAFNYADFDTCDELQGYFGFDKTENINYILLGEGGCAVPDVDYSLALQDGLLTIDKHTFDKDALIIEDTQVQKVLLLDKGKNPYLSVHFDAPLVGLWSPPSKDAPFVCIEPWYGRCDRIGFDGEFRDRDWVNSLDAGQVFKASYRIEIE